MCVCVCVRERERERESERERDRVGVKASGRTWCCAAADSSSLDPQQLSSCPCCPYTAEREPQGYEPFAAHAPIQWAMKGDVVKSRGGVECG